MRTDKIVEIKKYEDLTEQKWYNTKKDSSLFFRKIGYYQFKKDNKDFFEKYFETSANGGSYSVSFNSKNLDIIKQKLRDYYKNIKFIYVKKDKFFNKEITEEEYLTLKVNNKKDEFTEYIFY